MDDGSCIPKVEGCTLPGSAGFYEGVDPETPNYLSQHYGSLLRGVGEIGSGEGFIYPGVTNHREGANVLTGCVVAIEGCTDPDAQNYDPYANTMTEDRCVYAAVGCMAPPAAAMGPAHAALGYYADTRENFRQGFAINFDATATAHDPTMCVWYHLGCTNASSLNYDPRATVDDGLCVPRVDGCLDVDASNYGCPNGQYHAPCESVGVAPVGVSAGDGEKVVVTYHVDSTCRYAPRPPPSPSPPPSPPVDADVDFAVLVEYTLVGGGMDERQCDANFKGALCH